ncbi:MAG: ABC transporter permease [Chloroflexi bacterium]|nr:ABC transporter permease [Chloroflexota bacterium]
MTDISTISLAKSNQEQVSFSTLLMRRFLRHRPAVFSLLILFILFASAILAPVLTQDPDKVHLLQKFKSPSLVHPMGTDALGRDQLARILYGGRISLSVGMLATVMSLLIGTAIGVISGYIGGWLDNGLMRLTDAFLSFPSLFVLILLGALLKETPLASYGGGLFIIILVISLLSWMPIARLVRGTVLSLRTMEYIDATRALGGSHLQIMLAHILPNSLGPIIVQGALQTAYSIMTESGLSYLGFGVQPPTATWGNMLNGAQTDMTNYPWLAVFPGIAIFITVMSVNFIGDGLRDAFDPRSL